MYSDFKIHGVIVVVTNFNAVGAWLEPKTSSMKFGDKKKKMPIDP